MKKLVALMLASLVVVILASCGRGGGGSDESAHPSAQGSPAKPWIRYAGTWRGAPLDSTKPAGSVTLTLSALPGQTAIGANPVASVAVQLGSAAPVVMTAPNSNDAAGRPQYVFSFGRLAEAPNCTGSFPTLPVDIKVTDSTGFAYTKHVATCASVAQMDFGAFSDSGSTWASFSYESSAPITAFATRTSPTNSVDELVSASQSKFSGSLPSADGDMLMLTTNPNLPLPVGTRVTARIDGGGGTFAESTSVQNAPGASSALSPLVTMDCCGPRPVSDADVYMEVHARATRNGATPKDTTYTYRLAISDAATGALIVKEADTTAGDSYLSMHMKRGQVAEMEIKPDDPRIIASASARLRQSGPYTVQVSSNVPGTPARFKVFCCSP